jgi:Protein of unknown function (DUF1553)/Protein of unknown function (DUF1549)/Bacterial Ig-like domain (group 2)
MRINGHSFLVITIAFASVASAGPGAATEGPPTGPQNESVDFVNHVMPLLHKLGCNQAKCHGSLKEKSGFALSMFGSNPADDYSALTKAAAGRRINKVEPHKSLFLLKATASIAHEGAKAVKIQAGSPEYNLLASWIARGASWGGEKQPELLSIGVLPREQALQKGQVGQLSVTATYSDGARKDVTRYAVFTSSDRRVATVDGSGKIQAKDHGEAPIIATFMRRFDTVRVTVPQPLPSPFPAVEINNKIDEFVFAKLKTLGIPPSEVCPDQVFIRRAYLDVLGALPTPEEARAFLADKDPKKRSKLVDRLLSDDRFVGFGALKWGDLLRIKTGVGVARPAAGELYYRWVRESIAHDKPYDQFVRELVTASGGNYQVGPANFFAPGTNKDPQSFAEAAALVFMGVRIGCARCHVHPEENWTLADNLGLAAFFATVSVKSTREWMEEIVFSDPNKVLKHSKTAQVVQPKFLGGGLVDLTAAERVAQEAETAAAKVRAAAGRTAAAQLVAQRTAAAKRPQANEARKKRDDLLQEQKKAAGQALASVNNQVDVATKAYESAEKAARDAETAAAAARTTADQSQAALMAAQKTALAKRALAINQRQEDPRTKFAAWLISPENPWFAKNIVNRIWFWLLGRGIVHEADDFRSTNPPENAQLLQYLEKELVSNKYDLKHIFRLILNSTTYQLSSIPNQWNAKDVAHFSHYQVRQLGAEQLLDALSQITDTWESFHNVVAAPIVTMPAGHKATEIPDGSTESPFLKLFGRPTRDSSFESQRNPAPSMEQSLYLVNSDEFQAKVVNSPRMRRIIEQNKSDAEVVEELYLATLARAPTDTENKRVLSYVWGEGKTALDQANAERKAADEASTRVKADLARATTEHEAAEKTAREAEAKAQAISREISKPAEQKKKAAEEAALQRQGANQAKTRRDKLAGEEKAAVSRLAAANNKRDAASAAHQQQRVPALQDVLWTLLNTKEFMSNH